MSAAPSSWRVGVAGEAGAIGTLNFQERVRALDLLPDVPAQGRVGHAHRHLEQGLALGQVRQRHLHSGGREGEGVQPVAQHQIGPCDKRVCGMAKTRPEGGGGGWQECIRRAGTSEAAPEAVRPPVGGGCESGLGGAVTIGYKCH